MCYSKCLSEDLTEHNSSQISLKYFEQPSQLATFNLARICYVAGQHTVGAVASLQTHAGGPPRSLVPSHIRRHAYELFINTMSLHLES